MKYISILIFFVAISINVNGQNIAYTPLYDNASFNRTINVNLPVGGTGEGGAVSDDGSAVYAIEIATPPGTNGIAPSISLNYNSQSGKSVAGYGWNISGLSTIARTPRNFFNDGKPAPVELSLSDRFSLDGARLVSKSGTYGSAGSTYGTESESFTTVTAKETQGNGPKWFEVVSKDGVVMEYGNTIDSRFLDQSGNSVMFWRLNKIRYLDGNYIEFVYVNVDRDSRISEIRYTGNQAAGISPYNKIVFDYKIGADIKTTYEAGSSFVQKYLLDKITVKAETDSQIARTYQFDYATDNINSYLKQVTESGSDGTKLNSTIFKYGDVPIEYTSTATTIPNGNNIESFSGDYDGDGLADILTGTYVVTNGMAYYSDFKVYKRTAANSTYTLLSTTTLNSGYTLRPIGRTGERYQAKNGSSLLQADFNGDGLDDVLSINIATSGTILTLNNVTVYKSNNGTSFTPLTHTPSLPTGNRINANGTFFFPGDFNGDGILEYITILGNSSNAYTPVMHSDFITNGAPTVITIPGASSIALSSWVDSKIQVLDFNGDGKSDLMITNSSSSEIYSFDGAVATRLYNGSFPTSQHEVLLGDFNGDGKTDLLARSTGNVWTKGISTGANLNQVPVPVTVPQVSSPYPQYDYIYIGDYNGDGRSDILHSWYRVDEFPLTIPSLTTSYYHYIGLDVYYSQGDAFFRRRAYYKSIVKSDYVIYSLNKYVSTDLNGDGRTDLVFPDGNTFRCEYYNIDGKENLLQKVTNGLNHTTEWTYRKLTDGGTFYSKGGSSSYPVNNVQPAMNLVSGLITPNGIGGLTTIQYSYEEAKLDRAGRGFLGLKKFTAANLVSGEKTVSENEFNAAYRVAAPYKTTNYQGSTLLSEITYSNEFVPLPNSRFWLRTNGTVDTKSYEGRQVSVSNIFDTDGNITKTTTITKHIAGASDLHTTIADAAYQAIGSLPFKSKPSSVTVTNTRDGQSPHIIKTTFGYNGLAQLTSKTEFSELSQSVTTIYVYNNMGNLLSTNVKPSGMSDRVTSLTYDTKGRYVTSSTNPLNQTSTVNYDPRWGKPLSKTGIDGLTTSFEYDSFGHLKKTTLPEGFSITQLDEWSISGNTVWSSVTSHPGRPDVKTWYDIIQRPIKTETEGMGGQITQTQDYNARGQISVTTQPNKSGETFLTTNRVYDELGRIISESDSRGTTTYSYSYTNGNLSTTITSPAGHVKTTVTDATGKVVSVTDNGGTLHYTYNSNDNVTEVKNGSTIVTTSVYDQYGRQTEMFDKNAGTSTYTYNSMGQLTSQLNPKGQTTMTYNILGQVEGRNGPEGATTLEYHNSGSGINQIKKSTGFAGEVKEYLYDGFGRVLSITETVDGTPYTSTYGYNTYGDVISTLYPSGFGTKHTYDSNGYVTTIKNTAETVTLYATNGMNGLGQVTSYTLGNAKSSTRAYSYGFPTKFETTGVQNLNLNWNYTTGNLTSRNDARSTVNKTETFAYDNFDRLVSATIDGGAAYSTTYSASGNIETKTDAGTYRYDVSKVNAVIEASNPGNIIPSVQQDVLYTAFSQPQTLTENGNTLNYTYGADYQRIKSVLNTTTSTVTRYYFGAYEKSVTTSQNAPTPETKYIHYIASPAGLIAIVERKGASDTYHYTYTDHLGSILTVTNNSGAIEAEQNFDAWGRRRNATTWVPILPTAATSLPDWLYRGYTGHEHLDQFGLINMNGRLYDPVLARMLSPDNYVQAPDMTQSYNRYTYALNNPLIYTDPDGNFWNFVIGAAIGGFSGWRIGKAQGASGWEMAGYIFAGAGIGAITAGAGDLAMGAFSTAGASSGALGAAASVKAFAVAGAFGGAISGGAFAALAGGDFLKGALMGGLGGGAIGALSGYLNYVNFDARLTRALSNPDNWIAETGPIATTYQLREVVIIGKAPTIGHPGPMESMVPFWGSARSAGAYFEEGNILAGLGYSALAVSDVFLVKAAATAVVKGGIMLGAKLAVKTGTQQVNRIYSARELIRRSVEQGAFHNFPEAINKTVFEYGTRTVTPNYFNAAKAGLSNTNILYKYPGSVNGVKGFYEIGVRPSLSGNTEVIIHRFFNPIR